MRADNDGEGGILALLALARGECASAARHRHGCSVLAWSARRCSTATASSRRPSRCCRRSRAWRSPRPARQTCRADHVVILLACSPCRSAAPARIGRVFGPVMVVWFVVIAVLGIAGIIRQPARVARALPHHALIFCWRHGGSSRSSCSAASCCASPAARRSTPTWATSPPAHPRAWFWWCSRRCCSTTSARARCARDPTAGRQPVLWSSRPHGARIPMVVPRHRRRRRRVAGAHHRRVLAHAAGHAARLSTAPAHPAHVGARDRPGLRPVRQLGPVLRRHHRRRAVRLERQPRRRIRHHGDDRHADHDDDDLLRRPLRLEVPVGGRDRRDRLLLRRRLHLPRRQRRQGDRRRLVPAADRRLHVHADDDLEAGTKPDVGEPAKRLDRPEELPRVGLHQPADARSPGPPSSSSATKD